MSNHRPKFILPSFMPFWFHSLEIDNLLYDTKTSKIMRYNEGSKTMIPLDCR